MDKIEQLRVNANVTKTELSLALGKRHSYWSEATKMGPHGIGWRTTRTGIHRPEFYVAALGVFGYGFYVGPLPKGDKP